MASTDQLIAGGGQAFCDPPIACADDANSAHRHILLADDDPLVQDVVHYVLAREGYVVDVAANGREALNLLAREEYDLVLMDISMPVLDGTNATREIRSWTNRKRLVPIVALTASNYDAFRRDMIGAGMNDYLMKPLNAVALLECVRHYAP